MGHPGAIAGHYDGRREFGSVPRKFDDGRYQFVIGQQRFVIG